MLGLYTFNINSQANILVNDNGEICLSDFGLSVFAECRKKKYASLCGGPESWLLPEYFEPRDFGYEDDCRPTPERDIYAFACVCIEVSFTRFMVFLPFTFCVAIYRGRSFP